MRDRDRERETDQYIKMHNKYPVNIEDFKDALNHQALNGLTPCTIYTNPPDQLSVFPCSLN